MHAMRRLVPADLDPVLAVYRDAVISQCPNLYSPDQIKAWAQHPERNDTVRLALLRGFGLVSLGSEPSGTIEAFGLLDPTDRLSLLYCRGRSTRQGRANALLASLEAHAAGQGCPVLRTEASQLSKPLLLRRGWQVEEEEEVIFAANLFRRWRMIKRLTTAASPPTAPHG